MYKSFCLSAVTIISISTLAQWSEISQNNYTFYFALYFLNQNTGWAAGTDSGDGCVYYTSNGGMNWTKQLSSVIGRIECMYFINSQTGWGGAYSGNVCRTTNGGTNWTTVSVTSNRRIRKIQFVSSSSGYFAGEGGCWKTTDGGLNWNATSFYNVNLYGLHFLNNATGIVGGLSSIFKTTNSGALFEQVLFIPENILIYDFDFINNSTGFGCGSRKATYRTTNQGSNWNLISSELNTQWINSYYDIDFVDQNLGYAAGQYIFSNMYTTIYAGIFYKTTNSGASWTSISLYPVVVDSYEAVQICEGQIGYMAGYSGKMFKSTNAGYIGIESISSEIPDKFLLLQNYPNPFNPVTRIRFALPPSPKGEGKDAPMVRQGVRAIVYDVLGREVKTLVTEQLKPGIYEVEFDGTDLPSGVYFYKLISGKFSLSRKMVIIK